MIPFDFEYYQPNSIKEALEAFTLLDAQGKNPVYYGGGSELISMARLRNRTFGAIIDLKAIPECRVLGEENGSLHLGSCLTLSEITEFGQFPLMEKSAGRVADHTMQCKITLGGNIAGTIIYRESVLPLLLTDSMLTIASPGGSKEYPTREIFREKVNLPQGGFIVKASIPKIFLQLPYFHIKKTASEKIDYPLITIAGLKKKGRIRIAFSGLKSFPFRDEQVEEILNDSKIDFTIRAQKAAEYLSSGIMSDLWGSSGYRKFVLANSLEKIMET